MHALISKYGDWTYRGLVFFMLCAVLWLNSRYVTREEFLALKKDVDTAGVTLRVMVEQNRVNDRQDEMLKDHEARLRAIEKVIPRVIP